MDSYCNKCTTDPYDRNKNIYIGTILKEILLKASQHLRPSRALLALPMFSSQQSILTFNGQWVEREIQKGSKSGFERKGSNK